MCFHYPVRQYQIQLTLILSHFVLVQVGPIQIYWNVASALYLCNVTCTILAFHHLNNNNLHVQPHSALGAPLTVKTAPISTQVISWGHRHIVSHHVGNRRISI